MENQENKTSNKNGQHHHGHKHHEGHHESHGCCAAEKCCSSSCCSGHKGARVILGIIAAAALLLIGFSWGARTSYGRVEGFARGWMMDGRSTQTVNKDFRSCACQGAGLNTPASGSVAPVPAVESGSAPLE